MPNRPRSPAEVTGRGRRAGNTIRPGERPTTVMAWPPSGPSRAAHASPDGRPGRGIRRATLPAAWNNTIRPQVWPIAVMAGPRAGHLVPRVPRQMAGQDASDGESHFQPRWYKAATVWLPVVRGRRRHDGPPRRRRRRNRPARRPAMPRPGSLFANEAKSRKRDGRSGAKRPRATRGPRDHLCRAPTSKTSARARPRSRRFSRPATGSASAASRPRAK